MTQWQLHDSDAQREGGMTLLLVALSILAGGGALKPPENLNDHECPDAPAAASHLLRPTSSGGVCSLFNCSIRQLATRGRLHNGLQLNLSIHHGTKAVMNLFLFLSLLSFAFLGGVVNVCKHILRL